VKTAKEWAASIVGEVERRPLGKWGAYISDSDDSVALQGQVFDQTADVAADVARRIIERLVERAQADARAPLLELLAELRDELLARIYYAEDGRDAEPVLAKIEEALR
jgi:hypothetical protein